ncbi:MAG: type II/IV secretion system protein [Chloroflexi bacterium]|nr:type II/IV secretion system protein [Chloroflexota bacterium]
MKEFPFPKRKGVDQFLVEMGLVDPKGPACPNPLAARPGPETAPAATVDAAAPEESTGVPLTLPDDILDLPFVDLGKVRPDPQVVALVPEPMARKYQVLALSQTGDYLVLAMADTGDMEALESVAIQTRRKVRAARAHPDEIRRAIDLYYRDGDEIERQVARLPAELKDKDTEDRLLSMATQTPVARIVDLIVGQAVKDRASDIHIEPQEDTLEVRYRVDGLLHTAVSLPLSLHPALMSRIKVLAGMNIAERRRPQDGQICMHAGGKDIDIRVATSENVCGEMAVLRILDKSLSLFQLSELGMLPDVLANYKELLSRKFGMILVSGPTGSGKTTTLYASINTMDRKQQNIITVEDPIEYRMKGINQIQVNSKAGLTFDTGLRAIMRLDPNVILVGEVRDGETAKMAVQAALTGHLVLSTIHANDTAAVLLRLIDLGVEPFLVWSAMAGVVAQRMVRRICPRCRTEYEPSLEERTAYEQEMGEIGTFVHGEGCNFCGGSGYLGRTGVYEVMSMSDEIGSLLLSRASVKAIRGQALKEGMVPMRRDGMLKVKSGVTTSSEIVRNIFRS